MNYCQQKLNQELLRSIVNVTIPAKKVEDLLKKGADPNIVVDKKMSKNIISKLSFHHHLAPEVWYDYTPLEIAASLGRVEKFKILRKYGADIHHVSNKDNPPSTSHTILDRAIDTSNGLEGFKYFMKIVNAELITRIVGGLLIYSPVIIPGLAGYTWNLFFDDAKPNVDKRAYKEIVEHLIKDGAEVTVGHIARSANMYNTYLLPTLCKNVKDINASVWGLSGHGTLLHYFADSDKFDAVRMLLEHGADLSIKNPKGETPIDLAKRKGNEKMEKFMIEFKKEKECKITKNLENMTLDDSKETIVFKKALKRNMVYPNGCQQSRKRIEPIIGKNKNTGLSMSI